MILTPDEAKLVRWYDYLWLAIPIAGIAIFVAIVTDREKH
jgi:hypothetical protein